MNKLDLQTPDLTKQNIEKLMDLFPNCVTEAIDENGKLQKSIDFDLLKQELSKNIVDGPKERYQLMWPGKRKALLTANVPINKTLRPCQEESVNFDRTENLFIEGDNLDALKLLQETYLGKVKMIYIDPPYNTGKDFVYKDNYTIDKYGYLRESGQESEEGYKLVSNRENSGRFHSDWLSLMYPRLKLARNLLEEDGAIFVSIGVEEVANLKSLMDDVFGESNFIEVFSWVKTSTPPALSTKSRKTNEYILCYEKGWNPFKYNGEPLDGGDQPLLNSGNSNRILKFPKDRVFFKTDKFPNGTLYAGKPDRVELMDDINIQAGYSTADFRLKGEFKWTQEFLNSELQKGTTFIIKSEKLSIRFIRKEEGYKRPTNFIKEKYINPKITKRKDGVGTNENASSYLYELMGRDIFSYPKPVSLMKYLFNFLAKNESIVMDFFSGSASSADGAMRWAAEKNLKLKYIMVQLPEDLDENLKTADANSKRIIQNGIELLNELGKPHLLTELAKERIRRAGKKIKKESGKDDLDIGFRVLKVDSSNMEDVYYNPDQLTQEQLPMFQENIKSDRSEEDLLFQVMLDLGIELSAKIEREELDGKTVYFVNRSDLAQTDLIACFDKKGGLNDDFLKKLANMKALKVVFRDDGFKNDSAKINAEQIFKLISPSTGLNVI